MWQFMTVVIYLSQAVVTIVSVCLIRMTQRRRQSEAEAVVMVSSTQAPLGIGDVMFVAENGGNRIQKL